MQNKSRSTYHLLSRYITKEFLQNFAVAFLFFFCIFFVNSIILLVQKILLKNIDLLTMLQMVALSMPQFLIYTFPFATLAASSMVLGDLSSTNELLAIRSCGISSWHIYKPIVIIALIMSGVTFFFADVVHPWSSVVYSDKLAVLMAEMPTFEIEPNSTNTVGNIVLYNGDTEGREIHDLVLLTTDRDSDQNNLVISEKGELELVDPDNFVYSLTLDNPEIFINDTSDIETYGLSNASKATFYLDFSSQIPSLTSNSPVNLTSRELYETIVERNEIQRTDREDWHKESEKTLLGISSSIKDYEKGKLTESMAQDIIDNYNLDLEYRMSYPINFYGQYYKAEFAKKFALSFACLVLAMITLPLSNIRVKHGKLTGFAISLIISVAYWYMLFGAQLFIFDINSSPYWLIFLPDIIIFLIAIAAIKYFRKAR